MADLRILLGLSVLFCPVVSSPVLKGFDPLCVGRALGAAAVSH